MNTAELRFLTDENINETVLAYLRNRGHDVLDVKETGLAGYDDEVLLTLAMEQNRVIVTHDSDFGTLTLVGGFEFLGILRLKPGHIEPRFTIQTLEAVFQQVPEVTPPFIITARYAKSLVWVRVRQV